MDIIFKAIILLDMIITIICFLWVIVDDALKGNSPDYDESISTNVERRKGESFVFYTLCLSIIAIELLKAYYIFFD